MARHEDLSVTRLTVLGEVNFNGGVTVARLPAAAHHPSAVVYCSNGNAGSPCLAVSNGAQWLRVALGAAVAAT